MATSSCCNRWNENNLVVVTGGNRGIGLEIVRQLLQHGLTVVLTARDHVRGLEACSSLVADGLQNVVFHDLDVESPDSIANFAAWLKEEYGGLDILGILVNYDFVEAKQIKFEELLVNFPVHFLFGIPWWLSVTHPKANIGCKGHYHLPYLLKDIFKRAETSTLVKQLTVEQKIYRMLYKSVGV